MVSSFTAPLRFEATNAFRAGRRVYRTTAPLVYHVGARGSSLTVTVPAGTLTDLASVPAIFRGLFAPDGPWAPAAVVHDHLVKEGLVSRRMADLIFFEAAAVIGVPWHRRVAMWAAVRAAAWLGL